LSCSATKKARKTEGNHANQGVKEENLKFRNSEEEWPFHAICQELAMRLLHPKSEIRHGSAIGLREILRCHGNTAGMTSSHVSAEDNRVWMEDCVTRILCVFVLDRFGDYILDKVIAPIRENCAQVLGVTLRYLHKDIALEVLQVLFVLQRRPEWEVRHSGFLGMKYFIAMRPDVVSVHHEKVLESCFIG